MDEVVHENGSCGSHIQAIHTSGHGNADVTIAPGQPSGVEACRFGPQHEGGSGCRFPASRWNGVGDERGSYDFCGNLGFCSLPSMKQGGGIFNLEDREFPCRAHGDADGAPFINTRPLPRQDGIHAESGGRAEKLAKVVHVIESGEYQ